MANPLKNVCEKLTHIYIRVYTWWCWHIYKGEVGVDVDQLGEEMECPPIECGQSDGATGALDRNDRVSQSAPDAGHVVTGHWGPVSGQWWPRACSVGLRPDAGTGSDRTLAGCVRSG